MGRLNGKVALITGAASGIGLAAVGRFVEEGAQVVASDLNPEVTDRLAVHGDRVHAVTGNAADEDHVRELVAVAQTRFGRLDAAFANAGIGGGLTGILDQAVEDWERVLRVNLIGPFLMIKHVAPVLQAGGGGAIILTASAAGLRSGAGGAAYSASKAGVINLATNAANQLSGANIRINAICPGLIETGMTRTIFERAEAKGKRGDLGSLSPAGRPGAPEEVADLALFLATDEARYINGQAIAVDGGLSSSHPVSRRTYGRPSV